MRVLILGGTAWLGRRIAAEAVARGHHVTCLARGISGPAPGGVVLIRAERDSPDPFRALYQEDWDAVIDVSRQPSHVEDAAATFRHRSRRFIFVSSCNVYADHATPGQDETAPLLPALRAGATASKETYGEAKVACEQHVLHNFERARSLILRVGLIGGPGDTSHRTGYWPLRFARPSNEQARVLVPDLPDLATQIVDVRDLAEWIVEGAGSGCSGIYNVVGETVPLRHFLNIAQHTAGHNGPLVHVSPAWLLAKGVKPWMGERSLPLWLPMPEYGGFGARNGSAARASGLKTRPLKNTLSDTLAWELALLSAEPRGAGLSDEDERSLLQSFLNERL